MYLAEFEGESGRMLQGCVRLPSLPPVAQRVADEWWAEFRRLVESGGVVAQCAAALRVRLNAEGALERLLFTTAPAAHEEELRRYLASFTRLDKLVEGSTELPLTRARYDELTAAVPRLRCRVAALGFGAGDIWFACNFRVAPHLDALLTEADLLGHQLCYQAHLWPFACDVACVRAARKNALRVRGLPGVPEAVVRMQQQLADELTTATALAEEFLAVETPAAAEWLAAALRRLFQRQFVQLKFDPPDFDFAADAYEDLLTVALHSGMFLAPGVDELCASALDDRASVELLGWRPSADLARRFAARVAPPRAETEETPLPPGPWPAPYEGDEPFIFVSYKRQDIARIAPVMESLTAAGCNVWYDRGIPGGVEWDAMIEEKLTRCQLVLLFVSQLAVESKYVRREVKFADSLNKPILSVKLEEPRLTHGMNMLLTHYQMLDRAVADFHEQLQKAIRLLTNEQVV